jgi:Tol biopolymer transport system component
MSAGFGAIGWTPDSRQILVTKTIDGQHELWLVPTDGGRPRKLDIDVSGWEMGSAEIRLYPNGTELAFQRQAGAGSLGGLRIWFSRPLVSGR